MNFTIPGINESIFEIFTHAIVLFFTSTLAIFEIDFLLGYVEIIKTGFIVTDKCPYFKKLTISLELDFITENAIIYVLMAWVAIFITAKALKLEKYGLKLKHIVSFIKIKVSMMF